MPFFQIDDQLPVNLKLKRLTDGALTGDLSGLAALGLWTTAGAMCQASLTDGVVTRADGYRLLPNPALVDELAHRLVAAELWHASGHSCLRCPPVDDGSWRFHEWFQFNYDTAAALKLKRTKAKELKEKALLDAVWARDCADPSVPVATATAHCRYCGTLVKRKTTRGETQATLDHVDPLAAFGPRNVVVACFPCNRQKAQRTPAQAGMVLRPPPRPSVEDPTRSPPSGPRAAAGTSQSDQVGSPVTPALSPPPGDAETPLGWPSTGGTATTPPTTPGTRGGRPPGRPAVDQAPGGLLGRARGHVPGRGPGSGSGRGEGEGPGEGDQPGHQQGSPGAARRRRRRGRGRGRSDAGALDGSLDAGAAPVAPQPGRWGSPFHGWSGPPSEVDVEAACPVHGLHLPCRRCQDPPGDVDAPGGGA